MLMIPLSILALCSLITDVFIKNNQKLYDQACKAMFAVLSQSRKLLVGWFCCFTSQVNSYGYCGTVSSPNHTFSWTGLNKRLTSNLCTYFRL